HQPNLSPYTTLFRSLSVNIATDSIPETSFKASTPGFVVLFKACNPSATIARLSFFNGTISAIVPIAANSNKASGVSSNKNLANWKVTPTPANHLNLYASDNLV